MNSDERLELLKNILLTDDREFVDRITHKIEVLEQQQEHLPERLQPLMQKELDNFVVEIPKTLGPTITEALKTEIQKSQDAVAEALYPIMGKMIKKYVQNEIERLNEMINKKIETSFSLSAILKASFGKKKPSETYMKEAYGATIEQIMIIEKESGLLKASYSVTETLDEDMVAGMLTAIKSFVEDAYKKEGLELESIDYELFTIHIQNFSKYYIAVVISGIYDSASRSKLEDVLLNFAQFVINKDDLEDEQTFRKKLKEYFSNERI